MTEPAIIRTDGQGRPATRNASEECWSGSSHAWIPCSMVTSMIGGAADIDQVTEDQARELFPEAFAGP